MTLGKIDFHDVPNSYRARTSNSHKYKYLSLAFSSRSLAEMEKLSRVSSPSRSSVKISAFSLRHEPAVMKNSIEFQFSFREAMFYVSLSI